VSQAASHATSGAAGRAAQLRQAFDRTFADPIRVDTALNVDLLAIEVGAQTYAIRLSEISGLFAGKKITNVPGGTAALLGVAGFRGALVPVYDLKVLLGEASSRGPRWLVIAQAAPIALAFDAFLARLRVKQEEIAPHSARAHAPRHAHELVRTGSFMGPLLHLPSLLELIKAPGQQQIRQRND
jgi:purine-binding chemotaxis protein CheW